MLQVRRQILRFENLTKLCARSMGKMDQFKWKRPKDRPNKKPRLSIILLEKHKKLGNAGQLVPVKRGYARNFLVPQGLAAYATKENMKKYLREVDPADAAPESQVCLKFMAFVRRTHLKIKRKENEFFEVSEHHLALEYQRQYQLYVPVHCIIIEEPMRSFGQFVVNVAVRDGVVVPMKVSVEERRPFVPDRFKDVLSSEDYIKKQTQA